MHNHQEHRQPDDRAKGSGVTSDGATRGAVRRHGTARPWVFGSVAPGTAKPDSDVDLHYQLEPDRRLGWAIEQLAHELVVHGQSGWPRETT
jgi:predicted nucleotidyltransferase